MTTPIGPGLRQLQATLELNDAEVAHLATRYPDNELTGPAGFVADIIAATKDPQLARRLGSRATKMKVELTDLLLKAKAVLLADGPDALGRYLDNHPWLKYLNP